MDFGAFLLLGDNRRRLVVFGRLRLSGGGAGAAGRLADRPAQCLHRCGWKDFIFPQRSCCVLTAADVLAFHAAQHARVLLMDECGIGVALERKVGEGIPARPDRCVAGLRHRWCFAGNCSLSECESRRGWRLDRGRRAWMALALRCTGREPFVLRGRLAVDCG